MIRGGGSQENARNVPRFGGGANVICIFEKNACNGPCPVVQWLASKREGSMFFDYRTNLYRRNSLALSFFLFYIQCIWISMIFDFFSIYIEVRDTHFLDSYYVKKKLFRLFWYIDLLLFTLNCIKLYTWEIYHLHESRLCSFIFIAKKLFAIVRFLRLFNLNFPRQNKSNDRSFSTDFWLDSVHDREFSSIFHDITSQDSRY